MQVNISDFVAALQGSTKLADAMLGTVMSRRPVCLEELCTEDQIPIVLKEIGAAGILFYSFVHAASTQSSTDKTTLEVATVLLTVIDGIHKQTPPDEVKKTLLKIWPDLEERIDEGQRKPI